jgi:hypothetical protein
MSTRLILAGFVCMTVMTGCTAGSIAGAVAGTEAGENKFYTELKKSLVDAGTSQAVANCVETEMRKTVTRADIAAVVQATVDGKQPPSDKVQKAGEEAGKICQARALTGGATN